MGIKEDGSSIVSLSALKGQGVKEILRILQAKARPGRWLFSPGVVTNRSQEEQANEIIREKVFHFLNQEIPYELIVVHRGWKKINGMLALDAELLCQSPSQQRIVSKIRRQLEYAASDDISKLFGRQIRVMIQVGLDKSWDYAKQTHNDSICFKIQSWISIQLYTDAHSIRNRSWSCLSLPSLSPHHDFELDRRRQILRQQSNHSLDVLLRLHDHTRRIPHSSLLVPFPSTPFSAVYAFLSVIDIIRDAGSSEALIEATRRWFERADSLGSREKTEVCYADKRRAEIDPSICNTPETPNTPF